MLSVSELPVIDSFLLRTFRTLKACLSKAFFVRFVDVVCFGVAEIVLLLLDCFLFIYSVSELVDSLFYFPVILAGTSTAFGNLITAFSLPAPY